MKKNNFVLILLIVLLIFLISLLLCFLNFSFIFIDDTNILKDNILRQPPNGLYLPSILDVLFSYYLPSIINIHPSDFKSVYFKYIETFLILLFTFIYTKIIYKNKNKTEFIAYFIFSSMLILLIVQKISILWLFVYDGFFRMFLSVFLLLSVFYFLSKNENHLKDKIFIILLSFCCCITNEMIMIILNINFFLSGFYFLIKKQFKNFKCNLLYIFSSISGLTISISKGAFSRKSNNEIIDIEYIKNIFYLIPDFIKDFIYYIFFQHFFEYLLLIVSLIILHKKNLIKDNKNIIIIFNFLIGIIIFFFMLIGLGKTHYSENNFWIIHTDLHVIYTIIMSAFILLLLNNIVKIKMNIIIILTILLGIQNFIYYNNLSNFIKFLRIETYKTEKIIRLANLNNKKAYINKNMLEENHFWHFFENYSERNIYIEYETSPYIIFLNQFEKKKITTKYIFTDELIVNKEFRKNGGVFTDKELQNIKYNNLLDNNFLLNKY